jgi:hypothetical protein
MKPIISMCAIAAMTCSVAAWADKPEQYPIAYQVTGFLVADCGDFLVLQDYGVEGYERHYFNKDGSLNRIFSNLDFPDGIYYNANDPSYWLAGTAEHTQSWLHFDENGDPINYVESGPAFRIIVPGYGAVFIGTGHAIYDANAGQWTFLAGPRDFLRGNFDALCAALRP